jgi:hypothetical protein
MENILVNVAKQAIELLEESDSDNELLLEAVAEDVFISGRSQICFALANGDLEIGKVSLDVFYSLVH